MESFKEWLVENKADIRYLGHGKWAGHAWVTFAINGERYEYGIDPGFLEYNKQWKFLINKGYHGKALNLVKKNALYTQKKEAPAKKPEPKVKPQPNWPEDWELESRKQQARMQGMRIPY